MKISFEKLNYKALLAAIQSWILSVFSGKQKPEAPDNEEGDEEPSPPPNDTPDPTRPDLTYLKNHFQDAISSFYKTIEKIMEDNPVDAGLLMQLAEKAKDGTISPDELDKLKKLKGAATWQAMAVGAVCGFFLKYRPYPMLAEIRQKEKLFQPPFGPIVVVDGDTVRDVLSRHAEFTVDPYGREMVKSMTPQYNGGLDTFILSTDDNDKYVADKDLLTTVVNKADGEKITGLVHEDSMKRLREAVNKARQEGNSLIDVVTTVARFVPVTLAHHYFGVPAANQKGCFELTDDMLKYYGNKIAGPDGQTPLPTTYQNPDGATIELPDSALTRSDGVIPDETQIYEWIKASFWNFFNNVQKDIEVQARGIRAYRELLVYIQREIAIQREALLAGDSDSALPDTMLTRLLKIQMGMSNGTGDNLQVDPNRVNDLRISENVMGTLVGAIAGQEEATCRVIDSMIRLKEGEYEPGGSENLSGDQRYGTFEDARELAINVLEQRDVEQSRHELRRYVFEALRLQPQGEVLLRECIKEGATIAESRPIRKGTLVFAAHGSAMNDIDQPNSFILGRDGKHYLQYGYGRHKCLGQYVSPVLMVEALIVVLALENIRRPEPRLGETAFPLERRFGRFQLDDNNLYAETFTLRFDDTGTSKKYFG
ncbi:MAG: hypothetical protein ABFS02_04250 [Pseudomonadota bacterium]